MAATDLLETLVLAHTLNQVSFSILNWYVGLWNDDPTSAGLLTDEVSNTEYQRVPVSWDSSNTNSTLLVWPAGTSNWGDINFVCLLDSPTKGEGNMYIFQLYNPPLEVLPGNQLQIEPGELLITLV